MKHVRKIFAFALSLFMAFAIVAPAFAEGEEGGTATATTGTIVISNSAKNEDYKAYKVFAAKISDATTNGTADSIAYTYEYGTTLPDVLAKYFTMDAKGNVTAKKTTLSKAESDEIAAWAKTNATTSTETQKGTGGELRFENLELGYYVVTTSQGQGIVSINSTNPTANIVDKNTTAPILPPSDNTTEYKTVEDTDLAIGEVTTYTISFRTANYYDGDKLITSYTIEDDFANGKLELVGDPIVTVSGATNPAYTVNSWNTTDGGKITIPWCNEAKTESLYNNKAVITVTYTAKLTSTANIAGDGNTNTATLNYTYKDPDNPENPDVPGTSVTDTATVYTYALAIKKVDQSGEALKGAKFTIKKGNTNITVTDNGDGVYTVGGNVAEVESPEGTGLIIIKGVESGTYTLTETAAPDGYNKLVDPIDVTVTKTTAKRTNVTTYYDKDGNEVESAVDEGFDVLVDISNLAASAYVVVNKTGAEMPSTGGIGTTIFYIVGGVMVAGAAIFLLTKRRVSNAE